MVDREKVLRGLECCTRETYDPDCHSCPYEGEGDGITCVVDHLMRDVLEFIREVCV